ncbi:MAG: class I SAM-dependent methyltransferase, partial [Halobacteriota archaeon]
MASQVADHADNLESPLGQTRNIFDICNILNGSRKAAGQLLRLHKETYAASLYSWDAFFARRVNYGRKYKKDNHKKLARIGDAYIRDIDAKKMEWNSAKGCVNYGRRSRRGYPTLTLERGARSSNCWGACPSNLRHNVALSYLVRAASAAYALAVAAWGSSEMPEETIEWKTTELTTDSTADRRAVGQDPNLELYLAQIRDIFDIPRIIDAPRDKPQIINYYLANKLSYRLAWSLEGFIHCGISYDGKRKKEDFREQARVVDAYIEDKHAKKVLELGYGLGSNSAYLARRNPHVTFDAIDISNKPLRSFTTIPNLSFCFGDYHNLSQFKDDSYDIVFVIEALCYS